MVFCQTEGREANWLLPCQLLGHFLQEAFPYPLWCKCSFHGTLYLAHHSIVYSLFMWVFFLLTVGPALQAETMPVTSIQHSDSCFTDAQ